MSGSEPLDPTQLRPEPIRCGWWPTRSIKAIFDVIGRNLGMERFEIGTTATNTPLSSIEDRPPSCRYIPGSNESPGGCQ